MPKPICVPCQRFYRVKRIGIRFIEAMPLHRGAQPGTADAESWTPYKLWIADLMECQGCGHQLISGAAQRPLAEHYEPDFGGIAATAQFQVNDC